MRRTASGEPRSECIFFRLTESEERRLRAAATRAGLSVSAWVRTVALLSLEDCPRCHVRGEAANG